VGSDKQIWEKNWARVHGEAPTRSIIATVVAIKIPAGCVGFYSVAGFPGWMRNGAERLEFDGRRLSFAKCSLL